MCSVCMAVRETVILFECVRDTDLWECMHERIYVKMSVFVYV